MRKALIELTFTDTKSQRQVLTSCLSGGFYRKPFMEESAANNLDFQFLVQGISGTTYETVSKFFNLSQSQDPSMQILPDSQVDAIGAIPSSIRN